VVPSDAATAEPPCPPGGLGAQQPTAQRRKVEPKTLQPPTRTIQPGDLVCGSCGEGNAPSRNFCRRCGHPLADATVARIPWWRRIFRRRKRVLPAGTRPGRTDRAAGGAGESRGRVAWRGVRKVGRRVLSLVVAAAALLALVGAFVPAARPWRAAVMDRVEAVYGVGRRLISPRYVNVHPVQATASSHLPSREPGLAIDRIKDFSWAEGAPGDGVGERLIVTFAEPVDIYRVGFYSGSSQEPEAFTAQPRPKDLHLVFSDGSSADVTLNDTWDFQPFEAGGKQVTEVVIRIDSVYGPAPDGACAIREVEFFTKA
nr:hypothetical protein [Actinomycetota bacterium]